MMSKPTPATVKLDWSLLLGFDQATGTNEQSTAARLRDSRLAKLGAKSGVKTGLSVRRSGSLAL